MDRKFGASEEREASICGVSARADLWLLVPRVAVGICVPTIIIFLFFWLQLGKVNFYVALVALLVAVFQVLLVVGLRQQETFDAPNIKPGAFNRIGAFWLLAVFFGAVAGWFTGDWAENFPDKAILLHAMTVLFTIVLPIVTSIPNYRYITARNAYITVPLLLFVTLLPSIVGWRSAAILLSSVFH